LALGPSGWALGDAIVTTLMPPGEGGADCTRTWAARAVSTYAGLAPGQLGLLVDSYGYLALCLNGAGAVRLLGLSEGDRVLLRSPSPEHVME
jgi:S-adenosylmethionine hydrolase